MAKANRKKASSKKKPAAAARKGRAKAKKKTAKRSPSASAAKPKSLKKSTKKKSPAKKSASPKRSAKASVKKSTARTAKKATAKKSAKVAAKPITKKKTSAKSRSPAAKRSASTDKRSAEIARLVPWGSGFIETVDDDAKTPKTKLTKKQLRSFETMLLDKRRELVGNMANLTNDALSGNEDSGNRSSAPFHMADAGSDNWEQEFTFGLIENERSLVREIDDALMRIEERIYGVCLATHRPIDLTRLRAKPWAKYCIEYARLLELRRVP